MAETVDFTFPYRGVHRGTAYEAQPEFTTDDALLGLKSTALKLGEASPKWIAGFYALAALGITAAGLTGGLGWHFAVFMIPAYIHLALQLRGWDMDDGPDCLKRFKSNRNFGLLVLVAIAASCLATSV